MTNQEIATLISERIGDAPIPFDSVRALAIQIYEQLGGTEDDENFEDIYEILLAIIPIAHPGGGAIIDDNNVSTGTTWSSNKIVSELGNYATTNDISSFLVPNDVSIYATIENVNASLTTKANTSDLDRYATIANVDSSLTNYYTKTQSDELLQPKVNRTELDRYIKFASLSQTDYNLLPVKDISTLYLTNDRNINYVYIGNMLIGGTYAIAPSPASLQYLTTDGQILWPTTLYALPTIIRNTYRSVFEYGGMEFSSYEPSITVIGNNAFYGSQTLSRFIIPNTVNNIGNNAFYGCSQLVYIDLGSGIKKIGLQAFSNTALTEITLPASLTTIGQQAFANCESLINIKYKGTMSDWETITKNAGWHDNTPATVVQCADGDIPII